MLEGESDLWNRTNDVVLSTLNSQLFAHYKAASKMCPGESCRKHEGVHAQQQSVSGEAVRRIGRSVEDAPSFLSRTRGS